MRPLDWVKIFFTAVLLHVALIAISILEVFIYSLLIVPGKDPAFYSQHAQQSGPWISGIFGFIFIFLLVRRFARRSPEKCLVYAVALPAIYIINDLILLQLWDPDWIKQPLVIILGNGPKAISSFLSYLIFKPKRAL